MGTMSLSQPKADTSEDFYSISTYKDQIEWLKESCYDNGLTTLLNEFKNSDERELLFELLGKLRHDKISDRIEDISILVKTIESLKLHPQKTLIIATAKDSESDGSKAWQYFFKFYLAQHRKWHENSLKPSLTSSYEALRNKKYNDVIIFDDFIGTGDTMIKKVLAFQDELHTQNITQPTIHVFALAGMEFGINNVNNSLNLTVVCPVSLKKGISEQSCNSSDDILRKKNLMVAMETSLSELYEKTPFLGSSLGYKESEALYQVQFTNCSNNVFPIFWMGPKGKGNHRNTLFYRL